MEHMKNPIIRGFDSNRRSKSVVLISGQNWRWERFQGLACGNKALSTPSFARYLKQSIASAGRHSIRDHATSERALGALFNNLSKS